jgi:hypothetical protein
VEHLYAWFPSYYFCAGLMLLGQFHCRCLAINHGSSAFRFHQGRAAFSDLVFVIRKIIRGRNPSKSFTRYGKSVLPQWSVYEWIENLKNGGTSVTHEEGARRPSTATNEEKVEHACDMVLLDRRVTIDEVATSAN